MKPHSWVGVLAVCAALVAASAVASAVGTAHQLADHARYSGALARAQELDARVNEEVARSRLGIVWHYDGLVVLWDQVRANQIDLAHPPAYARDATLAASREELEVLRQDKRTAVERFKTEFAVLRNAVRALPHAASRATPDADGTLEALVLHATVFVADSTETNRAALRCSLSTLGLALRGPAAPCSREVVPPLPDWGAAIQHAEIIEQRKPRVDSVVAELVELPISETVAEIRGQYTTAHSAAVVRAARARFVALGAFAAALLFAALSVILRLQASRNALEAAKADLEGLTAQLAVERDRQAELANLKSEFVSMTSHEFRTPLSVILSSADLLAAYWERWDVARRSKHLVRIRESAQHMTGMLERVLVIGRADSGSLELRAEQVDLPRLAEEVVDEVRSVVGPDRVLALSMPDSAVVPLDPRLVRHILTNLLTNAFKYSPDHSPVALEVTADADAVRFVVDDKGIGIPVEEQASLFEPFRRCSNAHDIAGTGLGLAVVKRSVEVHGGSIEVESRLGEGTRFVVRIPNQGVAA